MKKEKESPRYGIYQTLFGNACEYTGGNTAWDIDAGEKIPVEMVDFSKWIRGFDE